MKKIIFLVIVIFIFKNISAQTVDGDPNYGIYSKNADVSPSGKQFTTDGFTIKQNKKQEKNYKKQKNFSLTWEEKALIYRRDNPDPNSPLTAAEQIRIKKIEKKQKKLDKLKGEFKLDSATNKQMWTPSKKTNYNPFSYMRLPKKKASDEVADATRGETKDMSKEQKKLVKINKKYGLDSLERDAKFKAQSGFPITAYQEILYKRAIKKEALLKEKTKKIHLQAIYDMQDKSTQKMMKERAKENKKRDKKRSRNLLFRKIRAYITFWN